MKFKHHKLLFALFLTTILFSTTSVFAQTELEKKATPQSEYEQQLRSSATVSDATLKPHETPSSINVTAPGFDSKVMANKPIPVAKPTDADEKLWIQNYQSWVASLDSPKLYLTEEEMQLVEQGNWTALWQHAIEKITAK